MVAVLKLDWIGRGVRSLKVDSDSLREASFSLLVGQSPGPPVLSARICVTAFRDMRSTVNPTNLSVHLMIHSTHGENHYWFNLPKDGTFDLASTVYPASFSDSRYALSLCY